MSSFYKSASGIMVPDGIQMKKSSPPVTGPAFSPGWTGPNRTFHQMLTLPGGGMIAFDLSRLTLSDFRAMRDHYQINASLAVLSFMLYQIEWSVECEDKQIAQYCEENLTNIWPQLVRAMSQSFWAGYSPNVLEWENNPLGKGGLGSVDITNVKDLVPERCNVNWKKVDGYAPPGHTVKPQIHVYNGIKELGSMWPIPTDNSYWYPLLMENGDYSGRKLLRPAFTSWFFSTLVHLFANRYYERFGEPVPVGRAPYDEEITIGTDGSQQTMSGAALMEMVISQLRSRSVVVLPNDRSGEGQNSQYDYTLEYLESQMRGADFERYMNRLDEEMSLALFMPLLLLRTSDVGSYNLGVTHFQLWLWVMNALAGDWKYYIDPYILSPMVDYNFSPKAPRAKIKFQKLGKMDAETIRTIFQTLISSGKAMPDLDELGKIAGLDVKAVKQITKPPAPVPDDPNNPTPPPADPAKPSNSKLPETSSTVRAMLERLSAQIKKSFREGTFGSGFEAKLGFSQRFEKALLEDGITSVKPSYDKFYGRMDWFIKELTGLGTNEFSGPEEVIDVVGRFMSTELEDLASAKA